MADHHHHSHAAGRAHTPQRPAAARAGASLLRMSAGERLMGALGLVAALWLGVFWALT